MKNTLSSSNLWPRIVAHIVVLIGLLSVVQFISSSISLSTGFHTHAINLFYLPIFALISLFIFKAAESDSVKISCLACFNCCILLLIFSLIMLIYSTRNDLSASSEYIDVRVERITPSNSGLVAGNVIVDFQSNVDLQCGIVCHGLEFLGLRQPYFLADAEISEQLWRVGGASDGRRYHQADGLRPIILEYEKGTLYVFRNGDLYYWRHTDMGEPDEVTLDIDLDNFNLLENSRRATIRYNIEFLLERFEELGADHFRGRFTFYEHLCDENGVEYEAPNLLNRLIFSHRCLEGISVEFPGANQMIGGTDYADQITLGPGNTVVVPSHGNDLIQLSPGADVVVISTATFLNAEHKRIEGFDIGDGDILDLRHVIEYRVFEPENFQVLQNHVELRATDIGIEVWVDPDASVSEFNRRHIATLVGLELEDPNTLLGNGSIAILN